MSSEHDSRQGADTESGGDFLERPLDPPDLEHRGEGEAPARAGEGEAARPSATAPATEAPRPRGSAHSPNMLPARSRPRTAVERSLVRLIATAGIVGIGVVIAAIMVSSHSQGWVVGLVVSVVTVVLAAVLWSSRTL